MAVQMIVFKRILERLKYCLIVFLDFLNKHTGI